MGGDEVKEGLVCSLLFGGAIASTSVEDAAGVEDEVGAGRGSFAEVLVGDFSGVVLDQISVNSEGSISDALLPQALGIRVHALSEDVDDGCNEADDLVSRSGSASIGGGGSGNRGAGSRCDCRGFAEVDDELLGGLLGLGRQGAGDDGTDGHAVASVAGVHD